MNQWFILYFDKETGGFVRSCDSSDSLVLFKGGQ